MTVATFDYIIVGAGSAGCVLANRLSANPRTSVLLVEAGGSDRHPYIAAPAGFLKTFADPRFNLCCHDRAWRGHWQPRDPFPPR